MVVQADDRRMFDRTIARFPTRFKDSRQDFGTNVFLRDISADGVKLATKERMHLNDRLDLEIELSDGHSPLNLKGRVVWVRQATPSMKDIGMKLDQVDLMQTQRLYKMCLD